MQLFFSPITEQCGSQDHCFHFFRYIRTMVRVSGPIESILESNRHIRQKTMSFLGYFQFKNMFHTGDIYQMSTVHVRLHETFTLSTHL